MNKFFIVNPWDSEVSSFATETETIEVIEQKAMDNGMSVSAWMNDRDITILEGVELLYKPPRDDASLVPKGK